MHLLLLPPSQQEGEKDLTKRQRKAGNVWNRRSIMLGQGAWKQCSMWELDKVQEIQQKTDRRWGMKMRNGIVRQSVIKIR